MFTVVRLEDRPARAADGRLGPASFRLGSRPGPGEEVSGRAGSTLARKPAARAVKMLGMRRLGITRKRRLGRRLGCGAVRACCGPS